MLPHLSSVVDFPTHAGAAVHSVWPGQLPCGQQLSCLNSYADKPASGGADHYSAFILERITRGPKQAGLFNIQDAWGAPQSLLTPLSYCSTSQGYCALTSANADTSAPAVKLVSNESTDNFDTVQPAPPNPDAVGPMKKKIKFIQPVSTAWEQDSILSGVPATSKGTAGSLGNQHDGKRNTGSCDSAGGGASGTKAHDSMQGQSSEAVPAKLSSKMKRKRVDFLQRAPVSQAPDSSGCLGDGAQSLPPQRSGGVVSSLGRTRSAPPANITAALEAPHRLDAQKYKSTSAGPKLACKDKQTGRPICSVQKKLGVMYQSYVSARDVYLSQALYLVDTLNKHDKGHSVVAPKLKEVAAVQRALEKAVQIIHQNAALTAAQLGAKAPQKALSVY